MDDISNMACSLGIIICHPKFVLDVGQLEGWRAESCAISEVRLGRHEMFDSCYSPPSRYLLEMVRRFGGRQPGRTEGLFLFNPLLLPRKHEILGILSGLKAFFESRNNETGTEPVVFCDSQGLSLGYLLPPSLIDDPKYLILISCLDAAADAEMLESAYFQRATVRSLSMSMDTLFVNGFGSLARLEPYNTCCRHNARLLKKKIGAAGAITEEAKRRVRDAILMCAYISHHAGDVLFAGVASRQSKGLFESLAVHRDYAAILERVGTPLKLVPYDGPVPYRKGYAVPDHEHFPEIFDRLPADRFYVFGRAIRDYNLTAFHLVDHYAFLLGDSLESPAALHGGAPVLGKEAATRRDRQGVNILFHFNAGWPLKVYPAVWQELLVDMALERGFRVTLLDAILEGKSCRSERFESLDHFERLIQEHNVLVGMDSFPVHFASLVADIPCICLFSSTHPIHSRTQSSSRYLWLSGELDCAPCRSSSLCPRFNHAYCSNFAEPKEVFSAILALLDNAIEEEMPKYNSSPSSLVPLRLRPNRNRMLKVKAADLSRQDWFQSGLGPRIYKGLVQTAEFISICRNQRIWVARVIALHRLRVWLHKLRTWIERYPALHYVVRKLWHLGK